MPDDLVDENLFDIFCNLRTLVGRYDSRVGRNPKIESGLFADRLYRFRETLVDGNRDGRKSRILSCYACSRTRGCAAASPGVAGDDDVALVQLQLMR
jgi:hypothetical protein